MLNTPRPEEDRAFGSADRGTVPFGGRTPFRRFLGVAGPAYLVSVGYMDPGNWATDVAGGSQFAYTLLWVVLLSSLMATLLQTLCVRMGIAMDKDLAEACRDSYPRPVARVLWLLAEIGIIACDVAEVVGSAVALNLLFGLNLILGVLLTGFDVLFLLGAIRFGFRKIEGLVILFIGAIVVCFCFNLALAHPDWGAALTGLVTPRVPNTGALLVAVGILGATVMPHNLYLHSSLVQTRKIENTEPAKAEAIRLATWDTVIALSGAFFVNAAILILAASVFQGKRVDDLRDAYRLITVHPALGGVAAAVFAIALLASGQSSTITGTLAGQVVMEGFLRLRISPWMRRVVTRCLALIPALVLIGWSGEKTNDLLVFSQIVLSAQLPFAVIPLVMLTSDRKHMGRFVSAPWLTVLAYGVAALILGTNLSLLALELGIGWVIALFAVIGAFALWVRYGYRRPAEDERRSDAA